MGGWWGANEAGWLLFWNVALCREEDKASAERKSIHWQKGKEVKGVCVCERGRKYEERHGSQLLQRFIFCTPPNSSHTHRYCHRAIPSFQRWFKKRLQERTRFLYSRPVAMVTQNWVTPSLSLTLSPSYGQIIKSAHRCSPEHSGRLNVRLLALLVLWWLKCT